MATILDGFGVLFSAVREEPEGRTSQKVPDRLHFRACGRRRSYLSGGTSNFMLQIAVLTPESGEGVSAGAQEATESEMPFCWQTDEHPCACTRTSMHTALTHLHVHVVPRSWRRVEQTHREVMPDRDR